MRLFVYPCEAESVAPVHALAAELSLAAPTFLRWDDLHRQVGALTAVEGESRLPVDYAVQRGLSGLGADVLLVRGPTEDGLRALMAAVRAWTRRPIIAVVTRQSAEMTLATLFEHLCEDRARERAIRARLDRP